MSLFLTPRTDKEQNLMFENVSEKQIKSINNKPANLHDENDKGLLLLKKVYSSSRDFSNVIAQYRSAYRTYKQEKELITKLYIKIQKELNIICLDKISYRSKFLTGQSIPNDYIKWSRHIKESLMALLLHEEIYQQLDSIGVTEEIIDDMLFRLKELDALKYQALEEERLIQSLSEDEYKHMDVLKFHYSELSHYFDLDEENYSINTNEELDEAI